MGGIADVRLSLVDSARIHMALRMPSPCKHPKTGMFGSADACRGIFRRASGKSAMGAE